jgi:hypothetical protein
MEVAYLSSMPRMCKRCDDSVTNVGSTRLPHYCTCGTMARKEDDNTNTNPDSEASIELSIVEHEAVMIGRHYCLVSVLLVLQQLPVSILFSNHRL